MKQNKYSLLVLIIPLLIFANYVVNRIQNSVDSFNHQLQETNRILQNHYPLCEEINDQNDCALGDSVLRAAQIDESVPGHRETLKPQDFSGEDPIETREKPLRTFDDRVGHLDAAYRLESALKIIDSYASKELNDREFIREFDSILSELDGTELQIVLKTYTDYLEEGNLDNDPLFGALDD